MRIICNDVIECLQPLSYFGSEAWIASGVSFDTRETLPGALFAAIKGENFDAHDFLSQAADKGAVAALVDRYVPGVNIPQILVRNVIQALQLLASFYRKSFKGKVVAVTGSVGKTTTREMIAFLLAKLGKTHVSCKNYNNHLGLPVVLLNAPEDADFMILEMGMNNPGEISVLTRIAQPDLAIVTNVESVHIGNFESLADVCAAKAEIFVGLGCNGDAILNGDSSYYASLRSEAEQFTRNVFCVGSSDGADLRILKVEGKVVHILFEGLVYKYLLSSTGGMHLVYASAIALMVVRLLKGSFVDVLGEVRKFEALSGRGKLVTIPYGNGTIKVLDDSYNASLASMKNSLAVLKVSSATRKVAILGDMLELGRFADQIHLDLFRAIKESDLSVLILVGSHVAIIDNAIRQERGMEDLEVQHFASVESLLPNIQDLIREGDLILVKGSNGMRLNKVVATLTSCMREPGSERFGVVCN